MRIYTNKGSEWLEPCDRVLIPLTPFQLSKHHAIYIGIYNNEPYFIENKNGHGVHLISARDFLLRNPVISSVQKFTGNEQQRQQALNQSLGMLGTPYDLFNFNCEHFANKVLQGKSYSNQIKTVGVLGVLLVIGLLASGK